MIGDITPAIVFSREIKVEIWVVNSTVFLHEILYSNDSNVIVCYMKIIISYPIRNLYIKKLYGIFLLM